MIATKHTRAWLEIIKNIILVTIVIVLYYCSEWHNTYYQTEAHVNEIIDDNVIVIDDNGYSWIFKGIGFYTNDKVELTMNTMHTNTILDDRIENVKLIINK